MGEVCYICGKELELSNQCKFCNLTFCDEHRLPEQHNCTNLPDRDWDTYRDLKNVREGYGWPKNKKTQTKPKTIWGEPNTKSSAEKEKPVDDTMSANKEQIEPSKIPTPVSAVSTNNQILYLVIVILALGLFAEFVYFSNKIDVEKDIRIEEISKIMSQFEDLQDTIIDKLETISSLESEISMLRETISQLESEKVELQGIIDSLINPRAELFNNYIEVDGKNVLSQANTFSHFTNLNRRDTACLYKEYTGSSTNFEHKFGFRIFQIDANAERVLRVSLLSYTEIVNDYYSILQSNGNLLAICVGSDTPNKFYLVIGENYQGEGYGSLHSKQLNLNTYYNVVFKKQGLIITTTILDVNSNVIDIITYNMRHQFNINYIMCPQSMGYTYGDFICSGYITNLVL